MTQPKPLLYAKLVLARATRQYGPDADETLEARRDYYAAVAAAELSRRLGPAALTDAQLDTLAGIIDANRNRVI